MKPRSKLETPTKSLNPDAARIVLVEDNRHWAEVMIDELHDALGDISIEWVQNESEFMSNLGKWSSAKPDLFIIDLFLPWTFDQVGPQKAEKPESEAGVRCAKALRKQTWAKTTPIIISSGLDEEDIRSVYGRRPKGIYFRSKGSATGLENTVRSILSSTGKCRTGARDVACFLVHGHDEEAKETVARFVEKIGGRVVILHEQPNAGRTIIEKFEDHAKVAFAIVLLTPDDVGGQTAKSLKKRARQNVVFELGFFFAKLGRKKVCALHKEGVEIPSDIQGVIYTTMDKAGAWRIALARELKAAGIPLDYDKVI